MCEKCNFVFSYWLYYFAASAAYLQFPGRLPLQTHPERSAAWLQCPTLPVWRELYSEPYAVTPDLIEAKAMATNAYTILKEVL